jgi:hypothetical protein
MANYIQPNTGNPVNPAISLSPVLNGNPLGITTTILHHIENVSDKDDPQRIIRGPVVLVHAGSNWR